MVWLGCSTRGSLQVAQRAPSRKLRGGTRYPSGQGRPYSSTLLGQLGCPSEPCQAPGSHIWSPGHSSAHRGHTGRSLPSPCEKLPPPPGCTETPPTFCTLSLVDGGYHSYSSAFTTLPPSSQQEEGSGKVPGASVRGGGPTGQGCVRKMRIFWLCQRSCLPRQQEERGFFKSQCNL